LLGERPDVSWDLWALGVVAYETLSAALPFPVGSREAWRQSVLAGRYTPLGEHLASPPARLQQFFNCAFSVDRARRPRSASAFLHDLELALS
jgi:eukaryotic-like serine/threonine-protein kinase